MRRNTKGSKFIVEDLMGQELTAVKIEYYNYDSVHSDIRMDIESISFGFNNKTIVITAISATDELQIELFDNRYLVTREEKCNLLSSYIGKKLGFVWQCTHFGLENYLDMCILGFEQLHPNILILCEGSALLLFETKPI